MVRILSHVNARKLDILGHHWSCGRDQAQPPHRDGPDPSPRVVVSVSIDTEEDNWGSYASKGATVDNISELPALQRRLDRWGARPTYLVNLPPLNDRRAVEAIGQLSERCNVEIGAHCHPWHTPPLIDEGRHRSMMNARALQENVDKIGYICEQMGKEVGVVPVSFRAGKWGFGTSVAKALVTHSFQLDCSVTPYMNWAESSGPNYMAAPTQPYVFDPDAPLRPLSTGALTQVPVTVGFLRHGRGRARAELRWRLEHSVVGKRGLVGILDRAGFVSRRWLSPESNSGVTMVRLANIEVAQGARHLHVTFHSSALFPGATPFVRTEEDRDRFLQSLDHFLEHCVESGFVFQTLAEVAESLGGARSAEATGPE